MSSTMKKDYFPIISEGKIDLDCSVYSLLEWILSILQISIRLCLPAYNRINMRNKTQIGSKSTLDKM